MGGAPYLYTPSINNGSTFDFNPRAYSQASYAASIEKQSPKPKQQGPLVDLNRHPDSWMVVTPNATNVEPMPPNTRVKVLTCRGIQLLFRILQLIGALGLFVCTICIRGTQDVQGWIMRIPPAYDALLNLYAIYHLVRPAHSRPAGSSASYNFFALMMDTGLIPFYVYTAMFSYSNYMLVPGTEGRWRTFFGTDDATAKVLWTTFLTSCTLGGLHVLSIILDIPLLVWFRKISNMPPDMNPLDIAPKISKHKYKNSELSTSTLTSEQKHLSMQSTDSLPVGLPSPQYRQVPFSHSRLDSDATFNPHTLESARYQRSNPPSPTKSGSFYAQPSSVRGSRASTFVAPHLAPSNPNDVHSPFAGHAFPFPPGQDRASYVASRPSSAVRQNTSSPAPQAAQDPREAKQQQSQGLLRDERENWYVFDEGSDLGSPVRGNTPAPRPGSALTTSGNERVPVVPPKSEMRKSVVEMPNNGGYLGPYDGGNKENLNAEGIRRQLTVSSSVYSDDQSVVSMGTARVQRYYGDLADGRGRYEQDVMAQRGGNGDRVVSRTGVELEDNGPVGDVRGRNVIHAGLYYGTSTLKSRLCTRGKSLLYALCEKHSIPHRQLGKWIVAQDSAQFSSLEQIHANATALSIPTRFLTTSDLATEPSVRAQAGALLSPTTGILDSHTYMAYLHASFTESGGDTAFCADVVGIEAPTASSGEWMIHARSGQETYTVSAETVVNSAGLQAVQIANMVLPESRHLKAFYAKGTYYSYAAKEPRPKVLVYPVVREGHGGLGTHLTLDLQGRVRFGPDVQWVEEPDYTPNEDGERFEEALREIREYLPSVEGGKMEVDYCGVRPKLKGKEGGGGTDFHVVREEGFGGTLVNLCGIESPGLTSSLAIGEMVEELLYK
ncbi:FAD dependent oxidoreductase-like protein 3 [Elsinoe australis]|uniref:L-2-hydroxyglutarate dehydrogenase, mitochondrial n=1 Tax=Elsinoe australis TaxID=40998 RepID=A0A4U7AVF6_9PEZI|nr:FAD dependent oxidoreductase-like protein 3 [Elsinoe australis]